MTTTSRSSSEDAPLASTRRWRWEREDGSDGARWTLRWACAEERRRHTAFVDASPAALFPYPIQSQDEETVTVACTDAVPLASISDEALGNAALVRLFESLGELMRHIHQMPSPSAFGDHQFEKSYHTFHAFMAAEFTILGRLIRQLENDVVRDTAVETLATLRHELSAFHPHGQSSWTVGRPTPERISVRKKPLQVEAIVDFGTVALRPPEYDLAALRLYGLLPDHPVADRAFWKGYGAAVTCDLSRRISYFENLISLERLLSSPAPLPAKP